MSKSIKDLEKDIKSIEELRPLHEVGNYVRSVAIGLAPRGITGQLQNSIGYTVERQSDHATVHVGTNLEYAMYVEYGTGPKGAANHVGVSPDVAVTYRMTPWWVHENQLDPQTIEQYHWYHIDTKQGKFYQVSGQAAQPFLYPAAKDHESEIQKIIENGLIGASGR